MHHFLGGRYLGVKGMTPPCMTHAPDALEKGFTARVETRGYKRRLQSR